MTNDMFSLNSDTTRRRAGARASRLAFSAAMLAWLMTAVSHFVVGTGWGPLVAILPVIGLVWHAAYLRFKRHETIPSSAYRCNGGSRSRHNAGDRAGSGRERQSDGQDSVRSFSLLLP